MGFREYRDGIREDWIANTNVTPNRTITYTRSSDDVSVTINALIGGGQFNQQEKDKLEDYQVFSALKLSEKPAVNDLVSYDGETYKVQRYTKLGTLWNVFGRISRHNGKPNKG